MVIDDGTGRLHCRWWGLPYLEDHYRVGQDLMVYSRVTEVKPRSMDHPETEVLEEGDEPLVHLGRIVPVYPSTERAAAVAADCVVGIGWHATGQRCRTRIRRWRPGD